VKVLILGDTRFVGSRVCHLLVSAGAQVTVLHRGITGWASASVTSITGDRSQPDGLVGLGDARFDALLDLSRYFSDWTRAASETLTGRVAH
jgi:nucleoside-diphosphate-sugar epimerase